MAGLTLLECGAKPDDKDVARAAEALRQACLNLTHNYSISLAILFFDRLGDPNDRLPIYLISTSGKSAGFEASEKLARMLKIPELGAKKGSEDRRARQGGWMKTAAKKAGKGQSAEVGIELFRGAETADLRRGILGFLLERTKSKRDTAWEGGRDVDQSFKVVSRSDQE